MREERNASIDLTISSLNTISDIKLNRNIFMKLFYIVSTFLNSLLGIYIISHFHSKFIKTENYYLYGYIILYTFKWPISFILGTLIAFILIIFKRLFYKNENNENKPNTLSHILICFVDSLIFFYIASIPFSVYMISKLISKESNEYKMNFMNNYELIYIYIIINLVISAIIFSVFLYFLIFVHLPNQRNKLDIDEEFIKKIKEEINKANQVSGILPANKEIVLNKETSNKDQHIENKENIEFHLEVNKDLTFSNTNLNQNFDLRSQSKKNTTEIEKEKMKNELFMRHKKQNSIKDYIDGVKLNLATTSPKSASLSDFKKDKIIGLKTSNPSTNRGVEAIVEVQEHKDYNPNRNSQKIQKDDDILEL